MADAREQAELLSFHHFLADRFPQAWKYSRIAAEEAAQICANADAAPFYRRALASANRLDGLPTTEVAPVAEGLGVLQRIGDFAKAGKAYRQARHLAADEVVDQARLLLKEGQVEAWLRRHSNALRSTKRGLRPLDGVDGFRALAQRASHGLARALRGSDGSRCSPTWPSTPPAGETLRDTTPRRFRGRRPRRGCQGNALRMVYGCAPCVP